MKEFSSDRFDRDIAKKSTIMQVWENQHPVMYWWFGLTSISFFSVYAMLFTKL